MVPDALYWKLRHTVIFLVNLPFMPVISAWHLLIEIFYNTIEIFTCTGSRQIDPFWKWQWRRWE